MKGIIIVVLVDIVPDQSSLQVVGWPRNQRHPESIGVSIVDLAAREQVFSIAIALLIFPGDADQELVTEQRTAHGAFNDLRVVISISPAEIARQLVGRLSGDHVDRASSGSTAVENRLRPPQDLDLVKIVEAR